MVQDATSYVATPLRPVALQSRWGSPVDAILHEIRIEIADAECSVDATLELDGAAYERCLVEGHLGLDAPRGPGPEPDTAKKVRIVVALRHHLADRFAGADDPMKVLLGQLFDSPAELADGDAWRALDVTQEIAPGVAIGYRTAWGGSAG